MKINEKNLINFAVSKTPIDREGWLSKRGEVNKNFQKRWFILKGNLLFYFDKKEDKEPLGVIILEGCSIELSEDNEAYAFNLVFHGSGNRTYYFCCTNQKEMEDWMKSIASASYDYMKLMVAELQRQLDQITKQEQQELIDIKNRGVLKSLDAQRNILAPRSNPFDRSKIHNNECGNGQTLMFETDELSGEHKQKINKQKYIFLEMHEYYGQIFRQRYEEYKKQKNSPEQLINFD